VKWPPGDDNECHHSARSTDTPTDFRVSRMSLESTAQALSLLAFLSGTTS